MWTRIKIWLADLGEFLFRFTQTVAARFIKQYGPRAKEIVIEVALIPGLTGRERFAKAGAMMLLEVPGVAQWLIDTAIQVGYAMYQEDLLAKDTDNDGVPDWKDICPALGKELSGCVDENGCPDMVMGGNIDK